MGLIKLTLASVLGIVSYKSIVRVNEIVKAVHVPSSSLLSKYVKSSPGKHYLDAYKAQLPKEFGLIQGSGSKYELNVTKLASGFFLCPVFYNFERHVLKILLQVSEPEFKTITFKEGDKCYIWRVVKRTDDEILLRWDYLGLWGTTWFYFPFKDNSIVFGNSIYSPADCSHNATKKLLTDATKELTTKNSEPVLQRASKALTKVVFAGTLPFHQLYSKYLLASTLRFLTKQDLK